MTVTQLDATPENSNAEECEVCRAQPGMPCVYSTNPPIARDRMHFHRHMAGERAAAARKADAKGKPHKLEFSFSQGPRSTDPIVTHITITDAAEDLLHRYELSEHDFMRALRGGIIRVTDLTEEN